jgi:parallel beta-helix repeat protein
LRKNIIKKSFVFGIIFLFICINTTTSIGTNAVEKSTKPNSNGNILYVGGSGEGNYTKIQDAIDDASVGDTVFVYNGIYYENIVINVSIDLIGEDRNTTVIDGNYSDFSVISFYRVGGITVSGFTLRHCKYYGVILHMGWEGENTISNNIICFNDWMGIKLGGSNNIIKNNIIHSISNGIFLIGASNTIISGNYIHSNDFGMYFYYGYNSTNNTIEDNIFTNNTLGILIQNGTENIFRRNIFSNNHGGIFIEEQNCYDNLFYHNNFLNNEYHAQDFSYNNWDNGYPSGGNYWDDYYGVDYYSGPNQDIPGSDGIGDTPYSIYGDKDRYPLGSFDMVQPKIEFIKPINNHVYFMNELLFPFFTTIIIGNIDIILNATDIQSGIDKIELYIDNELKAISNNGTLHWRWENKTSFWCFRHKIKAIAYDNTGNNAIVEMRVWRFL